MSQGLEVNILVSKSPITKIHDFELQKFEYIWKLEIWEKMKSFVLNIFFI